MMKKITVLMVCLMMLSTSVFAASPWNNPSASYGQKTMHKFGYGLTNVALGWTKIFTEPTEAIKNKQCAIKGLGVGLAEFVGDTIGGALHLVTFPIPQIDIPLPDGGISLSCCKA